MDKIIYTEQYNEENELVGITTSDNRWIPADEANSDYQAYLESLKDAAN